ncbi:hypothetical protein RvY_08209 [Ramazzottius varieornatus]|uniref:Uncharacterized protein n=1 Tax=Ramazzottius varieornatus TaxID=947166 RepID=A0A1D1V7E4_RAMVA|nr:hypothetical protein RvY_08209 [Ramazzottius varieornatus]
MKVRFSAMGISKCKVDLIAYDNNTVIELKVFAHHVDTKAFFAFPSYGDSGIPKACLNAQRMLRKE